MLVMSGYFPQITCVIQWYLTYSYLNVGLDVEGGDQIISNLSLLLIPICLTDRRINHWHKHVFFKGTQTSNQVRSMVAYFWFLLIKVQIAVIYFHAATGKFSSPQWVNGTAVYYWVNHPVFGMQNWLHPVMDPLLLNPYTVFYITRGVVFFELTLAISFFFNPKWFRKLFILAVTFHFAIVLLHGLFSFFISMSGALVLFYLIEFYQWKRIRSIENKKVSIYEPTYNLQAQAY